MLTGLRAKTETVLAAPFNPQLSAHFWATAGAGTIVLTALFSSVREGNYTQKWNISACRWKLDECCVYMRAHTCSYVRFFVCMSVNGCMDSSDSCAWINAECSCEKICWFGGACPLNTIFTAVGVPLFQPQVYAHQSPVAPTAGLSAVSFHSDWPWL